MCYTIARKNSEDNKLLIVDDSASGGLVESPEGERNSYEQISFTDQPGSKPMIGIGAIAAMLVGTVSYTAMYLGSVILVEQSEVIVTIPLGVLTLIVVSLAMRRPTGEGLEGFLRFHRSDVKTTMVSDE